ncbi:unnamed protein product [Camellia sinensis]
MASKFYPWIVLFQFLVFVSVVPSFFCQLDSPRNIQTVYPFRISVPTPRPPPPPPLPPPPSPPQRGKSSSKGTVVKAVVATAASTLVLSLFFFLVLQKYSQKRKENGNGNNTSVPYYSRRRSDPTVAPNEFTRFDGNVRGVIIDEDGLDVLYWRNLQGGKRKKSFRKEVFNGNSKEEEKKMSSKSERQDNKAENLVHEIPLLRVKSSTSQGYSIPPPRPLASVFAIPNTRSPAPRPPPPPVESVFAIPNTGSPAPPPPPPPPPVESAFAIPNIRSPAPPPLSVESVFAIPNTRSPAPPPPPPPVESVFAIPNTRSPAPPPPPPPPPPVESVFAIPNTRSPAPPPPPVEPVFAIPNTRSPAPPPPPPPVESVFAIPNTRSPAPPPPPPPPPPPVESVFAIPNTRSPAPPPPPMESVFVIPNTRSPAPPPPPPPPVASILAIPNRQRPAPPPPPPPSIPAKKGPAPPPPPPKAPGLASSSKPLPPPKGIPSSNKQSESLSREGSTGDGNGQVKLKPLHWDKVNPNVDHSMVWHKIDGGSFRFDDDLMEALFGNVASARQSPKANSSSSSPKSEKSNPRSRVFILDARKSQNTAIVLRSLAISRNEVIDSLIEGQGLDSDTLEKLTKIAPTKEEESEILAFDGDPTRLADAESFLYHLLGAVPSAFTRFNAMLFRSNYNSEILHLKETLQTLDLACKELRTRGLFLKLLEAILKAGNRMNAGTSRGNAQAFSLTTLRKLSDVKSIDGKTTLLHFVVEEVVRAEGKRCVLNKNRSLSRNSSRSNNDTARNSDNLTSKDDKEREYTKLGLPVVGGLSSEFSNVKKAATMDYDALVKTCSVLTAHIDEIRQVLTRCGDSEGGFVREMKSFLQVAGQEVEVVKQEQTKVMELVKRTTEYYQAGASKDKEKNPLQLFIIVKDFLGMVDQACIDIARNLQKRKTTTKTNAGSTSSPKSPESRNAVKFPRLPENFMSDKSKSSSSESDDDF